jgi:hypothetical protein
MSPRFGFLVTLLAVATGLLAVPSGTQAQLLVTPLRGQSAGDMPLEMIETGEGLLLVRTTGSTYDEVSGHRTGSRNSIHALDAQNRWQELDLPEGTYDGLIAYGKGFVLWRRSVDAARIASSEVVWYAGIADRQPRVLYRQDAGREQLYLRAGIDGKALYIADRAGYRFELLRIEDAGRVAWRKEFEDDNLVQLASFPGAVAVVHQVQATKGSAKVVLSAFSQDGAAAWETPIAAGNVRILSYQTPGSLSMVDDTANGKQRLTNFDARTGAITGSSSFMPQAVKWRDTQDGLLVIADVLNQPYLAMMRGHDDVAWWRRYRMQPDLGFPRDGLIRRDGRLALLLVPRGGEDSSTISIAQVDRTGRALVPERCGESDPLPSLKLEQTLKDDYAIAVMLEAQAPSSNACAVPTDAQYQDFLRVLAKRAGRPADGMRYWDQAVFVRVADGDVPFRLLSYRMGGVSDAPDQAVGYAVRADAAASFAEHYNYVVMPHLAKVTELRKRFHELTGYALLFEPGDDPDENTFAEMQSAAKRVVGQMDSLPKEELERARREFAMLGYFTLTRDGFGATSQPLRPIDVARETFLEALRTAPRRAH